MNLVISDNFKLFNMKEANNILIGSWCLLDKGISPDEVFSITASGRRGTEPYAIFTQALREDVNSKIKSNSNNTVDLIYHVILGEKALITKIKFIGDKKIKDKKLRNVIISEEAKFWKFISRRKYLDINRIELDEKLLTNYFKNNGYFNISVESSSAQIIDESNFELVFNINAGEKYYFNNLKLDIPKNYSTDNFENILNIFSGRRLK